jgi:DNA polymerase I-like protein with 3'-5' exonuclease and polymerase domains
VCKQRKWPVHIITDLKELQKLKLEYGQDWLERRQQQDADVTEDDIPDRVLPETQFCILLESDKNTLTIARARRQLPSDLVNALLDYSKYDQRASSFGIDWLNKNVNAKTKRIHPSFHQAITTTGRLSSQPNLQNIPHDPRYRKCFVPRPGYKFVIADYSQQEPRLLAQESGDEVYTRTYMEHDDLYLSVGEAMLGNRPDRSTEEGELLRQIFKIIVLSMAYRSGIAKLRDQLTLGLADAIEAGKAEPPTFEYAAEMHKRFFEVHGKVREYQDRCSNGADPKNKNAPRIWDEMLQDFVTYVKAPCGRARFFGPLANNTYTEAANAPIQGGSASMTKAAVCLLQRDIDSRGWQDEVFVVNMVHDEIVVEAEQSKAAEVAAMLRDAMLKAGSSYCPNIPIVAEYPKKSDGTVPYWTKELK